MAIAEEAQQQQPPKPDPWALAKEMLPDLLRENADVALVRRIDRERVGLAFRRMHAQNRQFCERPEQVAKIEDALTITMGVEAARVEFDWLPDEYATEQSRRSPGPQPGDPGYDPDSDGPEDDYTPTPGQCRALTRAEIELLNQKHAGEKLDDGSESITVTIGQPDRRGHCLVELLYDGCPLFAARIDPDNEYLRSKFAETATSLLPFEIQAQRGDLAVQFVLRKLRKAADKRRQGGATVAKFNWTTPQQLATNTYDMLFHIPGVMPVGQPQGIFGAKKSLKTSLMLDQALSVATGSPWLGHFHVEERARVAVFSAESGMATIQETCWRICDSKDISLDAITDLMFCDTVPQFGDAVDMRELERVLTGEGVGLLYIDPAYLAMSTAGNEGSLFAMGALLRSVSEVCQRTGTTLTLLHHMRKGVVDPYSPGDLDDASWAGFAEFCRSWQLINRREKYEPGTGMHKLWLSVGGSTGHSGLWGVDVFEGVYDGPGSRVWDVQVTRPLDIRKLEADAKSERKQAKEEEKLTSAKTVILRAMAKYPDGETANVIRDTAGVSGEAAKKALASLLQSGEVVPCDVVKRSRKTPYEGYRIASE